MAGRLALGAEPPPTPPQITPEPISDDETGFIPIFDGKTLKGWDGDPYYWRVENGAIVGETTENTLPKHNSFIIWRGGRPKDFELKVEYRVSRKATAACNIEALNYPESSGCSAAVSSISMDGNGARCSRSMSSA